MRLIDADALLRDIEKYHLSDGMFQHWVEVQTTIDAVTVADIIEVEKERNYWHDLADSYERTILKLNNALQESVPVVHGHWKYDNQYHWYRACCSECGYCRVTDVEADRWNEWKYCPNCGARMSEE